MIWRPYDYVLNFLPILLRTQFIPSTPMCEIVSMESGSLCQISIDGYPVLTCCHISHSVGIFSVVSLN